METLNIDPAAVIQSEKERHSKNHKRIITQIRKDYKDIETQTNTLYRALVVTKAEIRMHGSQIGESIKIIIKALMNVKGDLSTLKLITSMLMKPTDKPIRVRNFLTKLIKERGGWG